MFLLTLLTGCQLMFPLQQQQQQTVDAAADDAAPDASGDAAPLPFAVCAGSDVVKLCIEEAPTTSLVVNQPVDLDTSTAPCTPYQVQAPAADPEACVIVGITIEVSSVLRARGNRPLVLFATERILVDGLIDVSSTREDAGAGAGSTPDCDSTPPTSHGGGAGGSFGGKGGAGGAPAGGAGGVPSPDPGLPTRLRVGCRGGRGEPSTSTSFSVGGGAVALLAPMITIDGTIDASGSGGQGGEAVGGGGSGGGSGGMILIDGFVTTNPTTKLFANGGGGGGGGGSVAGADGTKSSAPTVTGGGGSGAPPGGNGGNANENSLDGESGGASTQPTAGAGGGGGAAGFLRIAPTPGGLQGQFTPAPR